MLVRILLRCKGCREEDSESCKDWIWTTKGGTSLLWYLYVEIKEVTPKEIGGGRCVWRNIWWRDVITRIIWEGFLRRWIIRDVLESSLLIAFDAVKAPPKPGSWVDTLNVERFAEVWWVMPAEEAPKLASVMSVFISMSSSFRVRLGDKDVHWVFVWEKRS